MELVIESIPANLLASSRAKVDQFASFTNPHLDIGHDRIVIGSFEILT